MTWRGPRGSGGGGGSQNLTQVLTVGNSAGGLAATGFADLALDGLTGATADTRYVGATISGAPTAGTFAVGDYLLGQYGEAWVCIRAGTPGVWAQIGAPPLTPDTSYRNGREWWTNFATAAVDNTWATSTNLTYGTDGGLPAVTNTVAGVVSTFYMNDTSVKDFEVLVKWRASVDTGFNIVNVEQSLTGRRLNDNNRWYGRVALTGGANFAQMHSVKASVDAASPASTAIDNSDSTTYRWTKFRVTGDICFIKSWFVNVDEPDWMVITRLRYPTGGASPNTSADNQDFGMCGYTQQYGGTLQEIRITELVRMDSNLLTSPSPTHLDSVNSYPVGWYPTLDAGAGDVANVVSVAGPDGQTRSVFHLTKAGAATSCFWTQDVWYAGPNSFLTRNSPHPQMVFPRAVEVSLWSKGSNIVDAGVLASGLVAYQYDLNGTILNLGDLYYYGTLGPNGGPNGPVGGSTGKGDGTWGWFRTVWRMPFAAPPETIARLRVDVGIHDLAATGEIWLCDIQMRPVP